MRSSTKRGFTLIELLVVIAIIAILASILFPVFAKAREQARKATCISQIRQLATAIQMYAQDNGGQYPGTGWVSAIASYVGASEKMFICPSDTSADGSVVSYGYAGVLVRNDGSGVKEASVLSPSEVGAVCDASPSKTYPTGGLVGGGGGQSEATVAVLPVSRHSKGTVAGYCDGHAKYLPGVFSEKDMANGVTRAFYQVASLGLVDNPVACLGPVTAPAISGTVTVGGEFVTQPFLMAAAKLTNNYYTRGFLGQGYVAGRPASNWCWGNVTSGDASGQMATVALLVVVAKSSKIPNIGSLNNYAYVKTTAQLASFFGGNGYTANSIQVYKLPATSQVQAYANSLMGLTPGTEAVEVANDAELIDKVSNDPYGIGVVTSPFFDPDRVSQVALTATAMYPSNSAKYRWTMPTTAPAALPRLELYPSNSGAQTFNDSLLSIGAVTAALQTGPLFKAGYWP